MKPLKPLMKPQKPNNFPREGHHEPVTRDAIKRLIKERPVLEEALRYTIRGTVEAEVHSTLNAEREAAITNGSRRLVEASNTLADALQHAKPDARTEYIRVHREAAAKGFKRSRAFAQAKSQHSQTNTKKGSSHER